MKQAMTMALAAAALLLAVPAAKAGTEMKDAKDMKGVTPPECGPKDWTIEVGSGVEWSNVRAGTYAGYRIEPIELTAALAVDDVSLDNFLGGVFRGYTEFLFRGQYDNIDKGPEDRYAGILVGPRYNFVQPGWKLIPYVEGTVGVGFATSRPQLGGLSARTSTSASRSARVRSTRSTAIGPCASACSTSTSPTPAFPRRSRTTRSTRSGRFSRWATASS